MYLALQVERSTRNFPIITEEVSPWILLLTSHVVVLFIHVPNLHIYRSRARQPERASPPDYIPQQVLSKSVLYTCYFEKHVI